MLVSDSKIRSDAGDSDGDWLDREDLKTNGFQEMPLAVHLQDLVSTEKSLLTRASSNLSWNASLHGPYAGFERRPYLVRLSAAPTHFVCVYRLRRTVLCCKYALKQSVFAACSQLQGWMALWYRRCLDMPLFREAEKGQRRGRRAS